MKLDRGQAAALTGDDVRDMVLLRSNSSGYKTTEVDDLLGRVAAGLDAGHAAAPQIRTARIHTTYALTGYDIDTVDWLLSELQREEEGSGPAGTPDAWRDLPVVNLISRRALGEAADPRRPRAREVRMRRMLKEQCASAWRGFGQVPGVHLSYRERRGGGDLYAAGQQPLASVQGSQRQGSQHKKKISIGGRTITFRHAHKERQLLEVTEEIARHWNRDCSGHFAAKPRKLSRGLRSRLSAIEVAVDETGAPVLYISGTHYDHRADTRISFPGGRWLRFPIRGTGTSDAIMTAVDEAGNRVARYRCTGGAGTEIMVHPGCQLTGELALVIAASEGLVHSYFATPG